MPTLHHHLLTSDRIIADFEAKLEALNAVWAPQRPSGLTQFKKQLIGVFFGDLEKPSDEDVLAALETDARFSSSYPRLKDILRTLFTLLDFGQKIDLIRARARDRARARPSPINLLFVPFWLAS